MIFGTDTAGYLEVHPVVPFGDAHTETLAADSTSILGRTTRNVLRYRRSWQVQTAVLDSRQFARLDRMRMGGGPFWLFDDTDADMTPRDTRLFRGWVGGTLMSNYQLSILSGATATAGNTATPELPKLASLIPGEQITLGVTLRGVGGSTSVSWGLRFYRADGTLITTSTTTSAVTTTAARFTFSPGVPANTAWAMWTITPATQNLYVASPSISPGNGTDPGSSWFSVHLLDMTEIHYNSLLHAASLSLQET